MRGHQRLVWKGGRKAAAICMGGRLTLAGHPASALPYKSPPPCRTDHRQPPIKINRCPHHSTVAITARTTAPQKSLRITATPPQRRSTAAPQQPQHRSNRSNRSQSALTPATTAPATAATAAPQQPQQPQPISAQQHGSTAALARTRSSWRRWPSSGTKGTWTGRPSYRSSTRTPVRRRSNRSMGSWRWSGAEISLLKPPV